MTTLIVIIYLSNLIAMILNSSNKLECFDIDNVDQFLDDDLVDKDHDDEDKIVDIKDINRHAKIASNAIDLDNFSEETKNSIVKFNEDFSKILKDQVIVSSKEYLGHIDVFLNLNPNYNEHFIHFRKWFTDEVISKLTKYMLINSNLKKTQTNLSRAYTVV